MSPSFWGPVAAVVASIIGAWAVIYVGRRSKASEERTADLAAATGIASGYSLLTKDQQTWMEKQDAAIKDLQGRREEDRALIDGLRKDMDAMKRRYNTAVTYIRLLLKFIADHLPGEVPPAVPSDLTLDLD